MEEVETLAGSGSFPVAPLIFFTVIAFQFATRWLHDLKKKGSRTDKDIPLRGEIKQLLKEASSLSQPSTFAQAAKLRRTAAAKEKELANYQEQRSQEMKLSYDLYLKVMLIMKTATYFMLIIWFWGSPVASVPQNLVQPFGRLLSWKAGGHLNDKIMVGIIPWLILSARVSRYICRMV
ncbi:hypothetical protein SLEP1_g39043 [Rubroshorea leprosula]|uniref:Tail-anchored protein insertion receptor WRB n=1 Tax=Rubroshorea leprosula TaxID=152421 RepID=A0AAV5KZC0_9ROSI|nr:hypothetical protein SLEP1_g39043 [Rubroshorea leprosula]